MLGRQFLVLALGQFRLRDLLDLKLIQVEQVGALAGVSLQGLFFAAQSLYRLVRLRDFTAPGMKLEGDQQIGDSTKFSVAVIGAYLGTAAFAAVYAVWKPISALWIFWFMAAVAIVWSM